MNEINEYLQKKVIQQNEPVTYKLLSRELGYHVNTAKQALYTFSKKNDNVFAVYCVTGTGLKNEFKIQLVKEAELEEAKNGYKNISGVHVYSIASTDPSDFSCFYTAYKDTPSLSLEDRVKYGILKNNNVKVKAGTLIAKPVESKPVHIIPPKSVLPSTSTPVVNSKSASLTKSSSTTTSKKADFFSAQAKKASSASKKETLEKEKEKKVAAEKPFEKVKEKKTPKIFSDDEDEDEEFQQDTSNIDVDMDDELELENEEVEVEAEDNELNSSPVIEAPFEPVKKAKTNSRGYMVTETASEAPTTKPAAHASDSNTKPKAAPPTKKATNNSNTSGPKKQSSLTGFFMKQNK